MTLIVEDGTGKPNAESYVSSAELTAYASDRGITIVGDVDALLLKSILYIDQLSFSGLKLTKEQSMQWPRSNVSIDGFSVELDEIPRLLKDLQFEVSIAIGNGNDPLADVERSIKREKVDAIEVEYLDNSAPFVYSLRIKSLERKLTAFSGGVSFSVTRK